MTEFELDLVDLAKQVAQFQMMELPGQPMMMHMGTANLVSALWQAVKTLSERQSG